MRRSPLVLVALAVIAGCASRGQVRALETRLATMEAAARERANQDAAERVVLEGKVASLRLEVDRLAAAILELTTRVAQLETRPRPTVRPPVPAPDPAAVYAVPIAGAPALGPDDALVTIVRAGEYACPYCEKVRPTLEELRRLYGPKVRVVYRSYVVHPQIATLPAQAACAAHRQRRFWDMDRLLWEKGFATRQFDQPHLEDLAAELGLDVDRFRADLEGPCVADVQAEMALLGRFGVRATPAFFINGRYLAGAQPLDVFRRYVDEELATAATRRKQGRKQGSYYDQWVLGTGLPGLAPPPPAPTP